MIPTDQPGATPVTERKFTAEQEICTESNEALLFRQLSDALTGGSAATWDEVIHAAESLKAASPLRDGLMDTLARLRSREKHLREHAKNADGPLAEEVLHIRADECRQCADELARLLDGEAT